MGDDVPEGGDSGKDMYSMLENDEEAEEEKKKKKVIVEEEEEQEAKDEPPKETFKGNENSFTWHVFCPLHVTSKCSQTLISLSQIQNKLSVTCTCTTNQQVYIWYGLTVRILFIFSNMSSVCHKASAAASYMLRVFVAEIQVAISLRQFGFTKIHSNDRFENQRPKVSENYKNFQKNVQVYHMLV